MRRRDLALRIAIVALACVVGFLYWRDRAAQSKAVHEDVISTRADALKILFVGNSRTFVNDLPKALGALAQAGSPSRDVAIKSVTVGGATLRSHLDRGVAARAIEGEHWDYVVLQEQSTVPLKNAAELEQSVIAFDEIIKRAKARTAIYEVWARRGDDPIATRDAQRRVADLVHALFVPVGDAWVRAEHAFPDLVLYQPDGNHPTRAGTYLAARVFYETLIGHSQTTLPDLGMVTPHEQTEIQKTISP